MMPVRIQGIRVVRRAGEMSLSKAGGCVSHVIATSEMSDSTLVVLR